MSSSQERHTGSEPVYVTRERGFATLVAHYWSNVGFLGDGELMSGMDRNSHIPSVLIHGRYDVSGPADIPWALHNVWPASQLIIVESEGHGGPEIAGAVTHAVTALTP